jgi:hypothetical protein
MGVRSSSTFASAVVIPRGGPGSICCLYLSLTSAEPFDLQHEQPRVTDAVKSCIVRIFWFRKQEIALLRKNFTETLGTRSGGKEAQKIKMEGVWQQ